MSCSVRADALCRGWRTPGVGAVSRSSTSPGGHGAPGFVIHFLGWLSMALHTFLLRAWWRVKEGTARRRRWHASGDRMGCGAATVIHLHAVSGPIAPHSTVPMPSPWSRAWPSTRGKYGLGRPSSSLHRTQAAPAYRLRSRATPGRSGCGKAPVTAWAAWARVPMGKYHSRVTQGSGSGWAPLCPIANRSLAGRPGLCPSEGSGLPSCGVPLEGCHKAEPLYRGRHWEAAPGPAPGDILVGRPGVEVPGDFLRGACGGVLRCNVPEDGEHRPCGEGPRAWRGVHLDGPLWARAPHAGCVEHPSDPVCCQDQHHSRGLYDDPLCWSAVAAPDVQGHFRLARMGDSSTASWMFTLPRAVSSRIQPCATP